MSDEEKVLARYKSPPVTAAEERLFDLVWCRLGSHKPDGTAWKHHEGYSLSQPRTRGEFLTYIEAVSRYVSETLLKLQGDLGQLADMRQQLSAAQHQAASVRSWRERDKEHFEKQLSMTNSNLQAERERADAAEAKLAEYDALVAKVGEANVQQMLNGTNKNKRRIKL